MHKMSRDQTAARDHQNRINIVHFTLFLYIDGYNLNKRIAFFVVSFTYSFSFLRDAFALGEN